MATVKPVFSAQTTVISTELNSLANTAGAVASAEVDNTTNLYLDGLLDCELVAGGATTGSVSVYALEGTVTGTLSTTAKTSNLRFLGTVELNGTTAVRKQLRYDHVAPFWKPYVINNSGATLGAGGSTVKFTGVNYTDA